MNAPIARRIRCLIVDDEELPRQLLREFLAEAPDVEVIGECANGFDALKAVSELQPDLLLLDVQMPKLDGFEVLELIESPPAVIFTTAWDQYALRAFDAHAVDYLMKPFGQDRLHVALDRVRERLARHQTEAPPAAELRAAAHGRDRQLERLVVRDGTSITLIPVDRLLCAEAQDDYIALHTADKAYLKKQTIGSLENSLDPQRFVRVHRGWIVNLSAIARLEPLTRDSFVAVLQNGRQIPVSRSGHARLMQLLEGS
jgi:two-component system LytT family response regulator